MSIFNDVLSSLPVVGSFVNSDSENSMEDEYRRNQQLWQGLLDTYQGPESDPNYKAGLQGLYQQSQTGLTPADRAAMLEAYTGASNMARGREGAIQQQQLMRGGGVASSGQSAALQSRAAQDAAQRYQSAGMQQAGVASNRALQAKLAYLDTVERNKAALNQYRMNATSGMTGANTQMGNMYGARDASRKARFQHDLESGASLFAGGMGGGGGGFSGYSGMDVGQMPTWLTSGQGYGPT